MQCPLCLRTKNPLFTTYQDRRYFRCQDCQLIYLDSKCYLTSSEEKKVYDLHKNSYDDLGYINFLKRTYNPVIKLLNTSDKGLDFGCGNGPVLAKLFEQAGHHMTLYDHYYFPDKKALEKTYQFIVATDVIEHLIRPKQEIEKLISLLELKGILAIMTKLALNKKAFDKWHYKNDPTHVCFFSVQTFEWLAKKYHLTLIFQQQDVIILQK